MSEILKKRITAHIFYTGNNVNGLEITVLPYCFNNGIKSSLPINIFLCALLGMREAKKGLPKKEGKLQLKKWNYLYS